MQASTSQGREGEDYTYALDFWKVNNYQCSNYHCCTTNRLFEDANNSTYVSIKSFTVYETHSYLKFYLI